MNPGASAFPVKRESFTNSIPLAASIVVSLHISKIFAAGGTFL
jgi:hypothetical protein